MEARPDGQENERKTTPSAESDGEDLNEREYRDLEGSEGGVRHHTRTSRSTRERE